MSNAPTCPVIHFELHTDQPMAEASFFEQLFGWHVYKWSGPHEYWVMSTGPEGHTSINGGLAHPSQSGIKQRAVGTVQVGNMQAVLTRVLKAGGQVHTNPVAIPGVGHVAYVVDPVGTLFGLLQPETGVA